MPDAAPENRANVPVDKTRAAVGCLLGTAVGDALGLAVEGLSAPPRILPIAIRMCLMGPCWLRWPPK